MLKKTGASALILLLGTAPTLAQNTSKAGVDELWAHQGTWNEWERHGPPGGYVFAGDELGYDAHGVGDVNGDGTPDVAMTYYRRLNPDGPESGNTDHYANAGFVVVYSGAWITGAGNTFDPTIHAAEILSTCEIRPGPTSCTQCSTDSEGLPWEQGTAHGNLGCDEAPSCSHNFNIPGMIGHPIWGVTDYDIMAHSIHWLPDLDGDGADEMILGKTKNETGGVGIWSYTDKYNDTGVTGKRWVQVMFIAGPNVQEARHGWRIGPAGDINDDGQTDLMFGSRGWNQTGPLEIGGTPTRAINREGAVWIYCMPVNVSGADNDFWDDVAAFSQDQDIVDDTYCENPQAIIYLDGRNDYSLKISTEGPTTSADYPFDFAPDDANLSFGMWVEPAGDLDDDGDIDIIASTHGAYDGDGLIAVFLSNSDHRAPATWYEDTGFADGICAPGLPQVCELTTTIGDLTDATDGILVGLQRNAPAPGGWGSSWTEETELPNIFSATDRTQNRILLEDADLIIKGDTDDGITGIGEWFAKPDDFDKDCEIELVFSTQQGTHPDPDTPSTTYKGQLYAFNIQDFLTGDDYDPAVKRVYTVDELMGTFVAGQLTYTYASELLPKSRISWARWLGDSNDNNKAEFIMSSTETISACELRENKNTRVLTGYTVWHIDREEIGNGIGEAPIAFSDDELDNWEGSIDGVSSALNRAWPAGDLDGDGDTEIIVASWFYPTVYDGDNHPDGASYDPLVNPQYVRGGKVYVFDHPNPAIKIALCPPGGPLGTIFPPNPGVTDLLHVLQRISKDDPGLDLNSDGRVDALDAHEAINFYAEHSRYLD